MCQLGQRGHGVFFDGGGDGRGAGLQQPEQHAHAALGSDRRTLRAAEPRQLGEHAQPRLASPRRRSAIPAARAQSANERGDARAVRGHRVQRTLRVVAGHQARQDRQRAVHHSGGRRLGVRRAAQKAQEERHRARRHQRGVGGGVAGDGGEHGEHVRAGAGDGCRERLARPHPLHRQAPRFRNGALCKSIGRAKRANGLLYIKSVHNLHSPLHDVCVLHQLDRALERGVQRARARPRTLRRVQALMQQRHQVLREVDICDGRVRARGRWRARCRGTVQEGRHSGS
mmetsp:Transcript_17335/g.33104  ORF Transcript_17335/g.33104 Transcript_17335/m.33104 type:complete len:285 (+) Transcript_17335:2043-2897(+)